MFNCSRCGATGDWVERSPAAGKPFYLYDTNPVDVYGYDPNEICHGCHSELTDNIVLTSDVTFNFYYSAASYTSRTVLEQHEETNVLVSYRTQINGRIGTESRHFVDSGGDPQAFSTFDTPEYPSTHSEYLDYIEETTTGSHDNWSLRDYPCAENIFDKFDVSVAEMQEKTCTAHRELLSEAETRSINAQPVSILQGTTVEEYLDHAIMLRDHGVLTDYVAIGGIAGYGPKRQQKIILAIREFLPSRHRLHGLGVNLATLQRQGILSALLSADSGNWYDRTADAQTSSGWGWETDNRVNKDTVTYQYLDHRRRKNEILSDNYWENPDDDGVVSPADDAQQTLAGTASQTEVKGDGGKQIESITRSYMDFIPAETRNVLRKKKLRE